MYRALSIPHQ